jgi:NTP pyrophosphatase (non-canonical NTP hydrolase)
LSDTQITHEHRAERQKRVFDRAVEVWGAEPLVSRDDRARRFAEEAMELAQTQGVEADTLKRLIDYVYGRPVGDVKQEIGGVMFSLYCLAENLGLSVDGCETDEINRFLGTDPEVFRKKNEAKREAGV